MGQVGAPEPAARPASPAVLRVPPPGRALRGPHLTHGRPAGGTGAAGLEPRHADARPSSAYRLRAANYKAFCFNIQTGATAPRWTEHRHRQVLLDRRPGQPHHLGLSRKSSAALLHPISWIGVPVLRPCACRPTGAEGPEVERCQPVYFRSCQVPSGVSQAAHTRIQLVSTPSRTGRCHPPKAEPASRSIAPRGEQRCSTFLPRRSVVSSPESRRTRACWLTAPGLTPRE